MIDVLTVLWYVTLFGSLKKESVSDWYDDDSCIGSGSALMCTSRRRRKRKEDYRFPKVSGRSIVKRTLFRLTY